VPWRQRVRRDRPGRHVQLGVLTDVGYSKDPSLENAATVFTDWCNAAGGIDGRKLVADIHDTQLMAVVSAMAAA